MVYLFLVDGFEEIEAIAAADVLRRAGVDVVTVGVGKTSIRGAHGITVEADIAEGKAVTAGLEMVVLPGGPGTPGLEKSETVRRFLSHAAAEKLPIGAICAAPSILGHLGLLRGKKAVCYPGYEEELLGAKTAGGPVCEDGGIITANGPGAAVAFGLALAAKLKGKKTASAVAAGMQVI